MWVALVFAHLVMKMIMDNLFNGSTWKNMFYVVHVLKYVDLLELLAEPWRYFAHLYLSQVVLPYSHQMCPPPKMKAFYPPVHCKQWNRRVAIHFGQIKLDSDGIVPKFESSKNVILVLPWLQIWFSRHSQNIVYNMTYNFGMQDQMGQTLSFILV